jgi:hypothetical protein
LTVVDSDDKPTLNHEPSTGLSTVSTTVKNDVDSQNGSLARNSDHLSTGQQALDEFNDDDDIDWEMTA